MESQMFCAGSGSEITQSNNKDGFDLEQHKKLFGLCKELHTKKIKFVMSNADVELLKEHFPHEIYNIQSIIAKRSINSKKPGSKTQEVIIKGGF